MRKIRFLLVALMAVALFALPAVAEESQQEGEILIPAGVYADTDTYESLAPYTAYDNGKKALEENNPNGYAMLTSSARRGCNQARIYLAQVFMPADHELNGVGKTIVPEDEELPLSDRLNKYEQYMKQAADNNSSTAAKALMKFYGNGKYVSKNPELAFKYTKVCALQKDPEGMYKLGYLYSKGLGCPQDRAAAVKWMKNAAHAGSSEAKQWIEDRRGHYANVREPIPVDATLRLINGPGGCRLSDRGIVIDSFIGRVVNVKKIDEDENVDPYYDYTVFDGHKNVKFSTWWDNGYFSPGTIIKVTPPEVRGSISMQFRLSAYELPATASRMVKKWQGPKIGGWEDILK